MKRPVGTHIDTPTMLIFPSAVDMTCTAQDTYTKNNSINEESELSESQGDIYWYIFTRKKRVTIRVTRHPNFLRLST